MRILSRYFTKEFLKIFLLCQMSFCMIYLIIDFLQKIDNFIEAEVPADLVFSYFLYKSPYIMVQMIPVSSIISVIIMFCLMKRNNEIMALKASGFNIFGLSRPIIGTAFCLSIGLYLLSEVIVPFTSSRSNEIWNIEVEKRDPTRFYGRNQIWYRGDKSIYWIRHYDVKNKRMEFPAFCFFDGAFRLVKRIDGRHSVWEENRWKVEKGLIQELSEDGHYDVRRFDTLYLDLPETPETFIRSEKEPEEMSYWQLKAYAKRIRQEGYDDTRYLVDMHIKMAFPLVTLILVFSGIPIALGLRKGGTPLAVSLGMGVCLAYLLILGFSRSLGLSGTLPPILCAWVANMVFFFFGVYLMLNIER